MNYTIERQPTISGQGEAQSRKYHLHEGKSGRRWLVADQEAAAENVYVEGGPNSDGFAGATLTFPLANGGELRLKGPWHGNAQALYEDTGVDVRNTHRTFVVISRDLEHQGNKTVMVDVLYQDEVPTLGSFHRGDTIARDMARKLGESVVRFSQSSGGSCTGLVRPDDKFYWENDKA
jgi:hypothetical protein